MNLSEALSAGIQCQRASRLAEAGQIYRRILAEHPNHPVALHLLGLVHRQMGRLREAEQLIRQAIAANPAAAEYQFDLGVTLAATGQFDEAAAAYTMAIRLRADFPEAYNNLGMMLYALRRFEESIAAFRGLMERMPASGDARNNLGNVLKETGRLDEAITCYREAIRLKPESADAHNNLGNALTEQSCFEEAIEHCQTAIRIKPDFAGAFNNLGNAFRESGRVDEAIAAYSRAIALQPRYAETHCNLGLALATGKKNEEAAAAFRQAILLRPDYGKAYDGLGSVLHKQRRYGDSIAAYRTALQLQPGDANTHFNLGIALATKKLSDEAIVEYRAAIRLKPEFYDAHLSLANSLREQGRLDEALASFDRALQIRPDPVAGANRIFSLLLRPEYDAAAILGEARQWSQRHADPLKQFIPAYGNERNPDRRLKIGYVSPDFREHVVGWNLLALLREHDAEKFQIFCYASQERDDAFTDRLRKHADQWRDIAELTDEQAAELMRQDGIDILVDLSLHTAGNRLLVFARKPAPVQVSYLGYCGTTGLDTIDYRFSDPYLDPPGEAEFYSEKTIRLPETYWCYEPGGVTPEVGPLPALTAGHITFGCMNNFAKVSPPAQDLWARIMTLVPQSRLIIHANPGAYLEDVRQRFASAGVAGERLEFVPIRGWEAYLQTYQRIDISLDPFPYGGGITTCDNLWMGVPVVSLRGRTAVGRGGTSILSNIGLANLVAKTAEEYVRIATELAGDIARLKELRSSLRERMRGSPLMDAPRFARAVESAYREMWRKWCQSQ